MADALDLARPAGQEAERVIERQSAPPDLVVIQPVKDFTCAECGDSSGDLLTMDDAGPLCMSCADMDHEDVEFQRRFAAEITRLYPGCPTARAEDIAGHAGLRGSDRVLAAWSTADAS